MRHPPTRPAIRWAASAALVLATLAVPVFASGSPASAAPVDEAPGQITIGPGCPSVDTTGVDWNSSLNWAQTSGDYIGPDADPVADGSLFAGNCNGTTLYMLDQATQTETFGWYLDTSLFTQLGDGLSCHVWAYIPSEFAGDRHARYDFWADDGTGNLSWVGWPGHTIDQEVTSGWTDLGGVNVPAFTYQLTVTLSNQDAQSPGWYVGAGDLSVSCTPYQGAGT